MTPRELAVAALEFRSPERTPLRLWVLPWAERVRPAELAAILAVLWKARNSPEISRQVGFIMTRPD